MRYNFDELTDLREFISLKWRTYPQDVLPLWVADMDFPAPQPVREALQRYVERGVFCYPEGINGNPRSLASLRQAIIDRLARLYKWEIHPEEIVFIPGVVPGFHIACHAFVTSSEAVLVQTPVYPPILNAARNTGRLSQEITLPRTHSGEYLIDWEAFEQAITSQTRLFILCNPHNPIGHVFTHNELERLAEICLRKGIMICSDEIHAELTYSGYQHIPIATLDPEITCKSLTLISPSKIFNLAGLQCAVAIIQDSEIRRTYLNAQEGLVPWVNLIGLVAAEAAYRFGDEWLEQVLEYLQSNRNTLYEYVKEHLPGINMGMPQGSYLAWLDCRASQLPTSPHEYFLERARVALNPGESFGKGGEGFVRLNFACPRSRLLSALERMRAVLDPNTVLKS